MKNLVVANRITNLFHRKGWEVTKPDNLISATARFLELLRVTVSHSAIKEALLSHPDYPSLLSISESLSRWGIRTMELKVNPDKLDQLPLPFLAHVKKGRRFLSVEKVNEAEVICLENKSKQQTYKRDEFLEQWDGGGIAGPGRRSQR